MRPVLLDTNAYSAFKLGDESVVDVLKHAEVIGISPVVLGELLGGFDCGNKTKKNREELQLFLSSSRMRVFPISSDTAHFYSKVYSMLRNKGNPIPTNGMWIAAQAMEHGCVLCTFDKHFKAVEGLVVGSSCAELMI